MRKTKMMQWIMCQHIKIRLDFGLNQTNYRHWTIGETLDKPWGNYGQTLY